MKRMFAGLAVTLWAGMSLAAARGDGLMLETGDVHVGPSAVLVTVLLTNNTRADVVLDAQPLWHDKCGLSMKITGNGMPPRVVPNDLVPCSEVREVIPPGTTLAASRTLTRSEWFPKPGKYTVHVDWKEPGKGVYQHEPISVEVR
tara:strand:+ start:405 stop:839 length:435 start_codon:yes stop_codon:yes gene_type:complete